MKKFFLSLIIFCTLHLHSANGLEQEVENTRGPAYRHAIAACIAAEQTVLSILYVASQKSLPAIPYLAVGGGTLSQLIYPTGYSGAKFSAFCDVSALLAYSVGYEVLAPAILITKFLVDGLTSMSQTAKFRAAVIKKRNAKKAYT